jgi:hypothetical protein
MNDRVEQSATDGKTETPVDDRDEKTTFCEIRVNDIKVILTQDSSNRI